MGQLHFVYQNFEQIIAGMEMLEGGESTKYDRSSIKQYFSK